jgi:hypothetical protein
MRPRIRTVKPDAFQDEELWDLEEQTRLPIFRGYQGLWCCADREGRFEWRPRMLKINILPYWAGDFEDLLAALVRAGKIVRYEVDGRSYGWVRNFTKHQVLNNREVPSELPEPNFDACPTRAPRVVDASRVADNDIEDLTRAPRVPHASALLQSGREGNGMDWEGNGSGSDACPTPPSVPGLQRVTTPAGVTRVLTVPSEDPPKDYLDEAVMRGVPPAQAKSTWRHYFGAGLPERGVERLHDWLLTRAKERANSTTSIKGRDSPTQRVADRLTKVREQEAAEEAAQKGTQ